MWSPEAPGAADVFTEAERDRIEALWRLTAVPRAEFEATFGVMLRRFWRWAAAALRALAAYFGDGPSELRAIAEVAERRSGLVLDRGPALSAPAAPPAEEATADRPDAP